MGEDLLTVNVDGRETLLYPLLAKRLADRLDVSAARLPRGEELQEVARRHISERHDVQEIYRNLRIIFGELDPISIPAPLLQLARIPGFKLYVSTTFDVLTERAVDHERFGGQRQTLAFAYAPNDKQDLPPEFDRLNRPAVFHLMGRLSGTPHSYAVTREDRLEFMQSLQSKTEDSPGCLFDKLRKSNLLIMGSHLSEWLARLFAHDTTGGRPVEAQPEPGDAQAGLDADRSPVLFLQRFNGGTRVLRGRGTAHFVDELYRRWAELQPAEEPEPPPSISELVSSPRMQLGVVFLSCAHEDRGAAESIREALDRAGVDVILVSDDVQLTERWERKLRSLIGECSLFVPVISKHSLTVQRRFSRQEWIDALLEARKAVPSEHFILPVVIDDTSPEEPAIPEEFGEIAWEELPGGNPSSDFVKMVVQHQRSYRSASFA